MLTVSDALPWLLSNVLIPTPSTYTAIPIKSPSVVGGDPTLGCAVTGGSAVGCIITGVSVMGCGVRVGAGVGAAEGGAAVSEDDAKI